jgi:hypothetical protein
MNGTPSKKRELSKRGKKPSTYRRIVTGNVNGKAVVQTDEQLEAGRNCFATLRSRSGPRSFDGAASRLG